MLEITEAKYLIKIFEKEEYRDSFLKGNLYMNKLGFFKKIENHEIDEGKRFDDLEGITGHIQSSRTKITTQYGQEIKSISPIIFRNNISDHISVFCVFGYKSKNSQITEEFLKLGKYVVIILNPLDFLLRFNRYIDEKELVGGSAFIRYQDYNFFHRQKINALEAPYFKDQFYSHQSEYRFCIYPELPIVETDSYLATTICIGDISDICQNIESRALINFIKDL